MSKNIEINIQNSDGTYEVLYPKTLQTLVDGTVPINKGGTNGTSASSSMYNLTQPLSTASEANLNTYNTTYYLPCYRSSTAYKFPLNNLTTFIQGKSVVKVKRGSYTGSGTFGYTVHNISTGFRVDLFYVTYQDHYATSCLFSVVRNNASPRDFMIASNDQSGLFINVHQSISQITDFIGYKKDANTQVRGLIRYFPTGDSIVFGSNYCSIDTFSNFYTNQFSKSVNADDSENVRLSYNISGITYYWIAMQFGD